MKSPRYYIGTFISRLGYDLKPAWKRDAGNLNLLELSALALTATGKLDFLIQIGAFDGKLHDPLRERVLGLAKYAALVEPQPAVAERLRTLYQDSGDRVVIVEAAVAETDGQAVLYADSVSSPKASLNRHHLSRFHKACTHATTVETVSPATLLDRLGHGMPDLLQIDTEGMDWKILRLFFESAIRPKVVHFEHLHLTKNEVEEARDRLNQEGYRWRSYEWDTLAVSEELWDGILPASLGGNRAKGYFNE